MDSAGKALATNRMRKRNLFQPRRKRSQKSNNGFIAAPFARVPWSSAKLKITRRDLEPSLLSNQAKRGISISPQNADPSLRSGMTKSGELGVERKILTFTRGF